MITQEQVFGRARQLYYDLRKRSAPTYWKNGRMKGRILWPGAALDYPIEAFIDWFMESVGCQAFLCPYCNAPLDALSLVLDHCVALKKGGTNDFANLWPCCKDCNTIKGQLNGEDFQRFMQLLRSLPAPSQSEILSRLRAGAMGIRMGFIQRKKKQEAALVEEAF